MSRKHWFKLMAGTIEKATKESAAFDLFFNGVDPVHVGDNPVALPTGVYTEFSPSLVCKIDEKSGLANRGLEVKAGVIDADYRDEWKVVVRFPTQDHVIRAEKGHILGTTTTETITISPGDKIAQVLILELPEVEMVEDGLGFINYKNVPREGGFGSTGK